MNDKPKDNEHLYTKKEIMSLLDLKSDNFNRHLQRGRIVATGKRKRPTGGYENTFSQEAVDKFTAYMQAVRSLEKIRRGGNSQ